MSSSPSIFTRIVQGEIPCHRVLESPAVLAFLDINPLAPGHTLVIPKREVARLDDLRPEEVAEVACAVATLAPRILAAVGTRDYNVLQNNGPASGQEVPHVHFHIIPRRAGDGLGFRWKPQASAPEALADLAARIAGA